MKILYYFAEGKSNMSRWQNEQIFTNLEDNGILISILNPKDYPTLDEANAAILDKLKNEEFLFFLTPYNETRIYIDTLKEIKRMGVPTALICFDNLLIPFEHKNVCRYFDVVWLTSHENKELFEKWSNGENKVIMMPYASNPKLWGFNEERSGIEAERCTFLGSVYGSRVHEVNSFLEAGAKVDLYTGSVSGQSGNYGGGKRLSKNVINYMSNPIGRKVIFAALKQKVIKEVLMQDNPNLFIKPSVPFAEIGNVYSQHALAIATTYARNTGNLKKPVPVVNLRSFEIPMCGGIEITAYNKELGEYFEEGKEILFYRSKEQLKELVDFYTNPKHCDVRKAIKQAARKRAEGEHTWYRRFENLANTLGVKLK